ncbi:hypothetical protein Cni_G14245 [Canna indica]|uniref:Uncharacterized protein n=1 Tax=Canna indica TaxID=4628 RepID=A0AAQ3KHE2_9LILI|nr:hypothetical protein Cni_G14245 [Canna indica]
MTSTDAAFVIHLSDRTRVPVLSFSVSGPSLSPAHNPFFVRATTNDSSQVATIAVVLCNYLHQSISWEQQVCFDSAQDTLQMATLKVKVHDQEKSSNARTQRRNINGNEGDNTIKEQDVPKIPGKPKPNYFKPTLSSSCNGAHCHYPRCNKQSSMASPTTATSVKPKTSTSRARSVSSTPQRPPFAIISKETTPRTEKSPVVAPISLKERTPRTQKAAMTGATSSKERTTRAETSSTTSMSAKPRLEKASKSTTTRAKALTPKKAARLPRTPKARDAACSTSAPTAAKHQTDEVQKLDAKDQAMEEPMAEVVDNEKQTIEGKKTGEVPNCETAVDEKEKRDPEKNVLLAPASENNATEETANIPASWRNKVKALAGAFETAMSVNETEKALMMSSSRGRGAARFSRRQGELDAKGVSGGERKEETLGCGGEEANAGKKDQES